MAQERAEPLMFKGSAFVISDGWSAMMANGIISLVSMRHQERNESL